MNLLYSCYYIFILVIIVVIYRHPSRIFEILKYNNRYMYFKEVPMGITGVIYNSIPYIYDKDSLTKCGGNYDSVFEIKNNKLISKCFISENIVRSVFEEATPALGNIDINFPTVVDH